MMHKRRTWSVRKVATIEELSDLLGNHSWTGCTGFEHDGLLFLSDATGGDGAQEYGVVRVTDLRQVESLTVSWMFDDCLRATRQGGKRDYEAATRAFSEKLGGIIAHAKGEGPPPSQQGEREVVVATSATELRTALGGKPVSEWDSGIRREQLEEPQAHGRCHLCA